MKTWLLTLALFSFPALARADAMPDCPEGTHLETNPVEEGAMHHAGGQCVDDGGGGCAVGVASRGPASFAVALLGLAALLGRRRASRPGR